jgi:Calcium binding
MQKGDDNAGRAMPRKKPDSQAERLRAILGGSGERLPRVGVETLRRFHDYLAEHLPFPFEAKLSSPLGPHRDTKSPLQVIRLLDPVREYAPEEMCGLICKAEQNGARIELPLDRIDVDEGSPHAQLLEDYRHWLATCQ